MKITLENGMVLEGSAEQITEVLDRMGVTGDGLFYRSDTKGLLLIKDMQSLHLRNAILKMYGEWVDSLHKIAEPKEVVKHLLDGISNPTWLAMVKELSSREI